MIFYVCYFLLVQGNTKNKHIWMTWNIKIELCLEQLLKIAQE